MRIIRSQKNGSSARPYYPAILEHGWMQLSGHVPVDAQGRARWRSAREQTLRVLDNLDRALPAGKLSRRDLIVTSAFLIDMADIDDVDRAYREFFGEGPYTTRTTVRVVSLGKPEFRVEISATARADAATSPS